MYAYPHKLSDAITAYGLDGQVMNTHRAIDDALATLLVFDSMCAEKSDVGQYINLFGYNPKYGLAKRDKISKIKYREQPYSSQNELYKAPDLE